MPVSHEIQYSCYTEIYYTFKSAGTVTAIKVCKLEWLGYVLRMDDKRTVQKLLESKPGEQRTKG
jgi:hypothetical protein